MWRVHKDCLQISLQVPSSLPDRDAGLHQEIKQENYERDRRSEEEEEYDEDDEEDGDGDKSKGGDGKGRLRICFDPELELPRLQEWFHQNQNPNRKQVGDKQDHTINLHIMSRKVGKAGKCISWVRKYRSDWQK